jgi:hypothetical protein
MERSAPASEIQSGEYGIARFHGESGYVYHQGMLNGGGRGKYSLALYRAKAASGALISVVFETKAFDNDALLIERLLNILQIINGVRVGIELCQ